MSTPFLKFFHFIFVKSAFLLKGGAALAAGHPEDGYCYPQHHPKAKFDESVLPSGSAVYAYTALRWLEEHK